MPSDFNFNARFPFRLSSYQAATVWIQDFREKRGRWPTPGLLFDEDGSPVEDEAGKVVNPVDFGRTTFCVVLSDMKNLECQN